MTNVPSDVVQLQKDVVKHGQRLVVAEDDWQRKFQRLSDNVTLQVSRISKMQVLVQHLFTSFLYVIWGVF